MKLDQKMDGSFKGIVWYEVGKVIIDSDMSYMTMVNGLQYPQLESMFEAALSYFLEEGVLEFEPPDGGCVTFKATNISWDGGQMSFPETGQWDYCPHWEMDIEILSIDNFKEMVDES